MNHDPFCFQSQGRWDGGCICFALAEARADEREKAAQRVGVLFISVDDSIHPDTVLLAAIDAIRGGEQE